MDEDCLDSQTNFLGILWCVLSPNESQDSVEEDDNDFSKCRICTKKRRQIETVKELTPNLIQYIMEKYPINDEEDIGNVKVCSSCVSLCRLQINTR